MVTVFFNEINSKTDLGLFLSDVEIEEPTPKRTVVEVLCRDGVLDLSYALSSEMHFKNRKIVMTFKFIDYTNNWMLLFTRVARRLHGKHMHVVFDSDPGWYWDGFITVEPSAEYNVGTLKITCDAYPYKRRPVVLETTATSAGVNVTALVRQQTVIPEVTCTSATTITVDGITYSYASGTHTNTDLKLTAGAHTLLVKGSGAVMISYIDGSF